MSVLHGDHDLDDDDLEYRKDREISLGTSTMLGIFFVLTLLLAGFFGFGYALGRKSAQAASGVSDDGSPADGENKDAFKTFKPSPGTAAIQAAPGFSAKDAAAANASGNGVQFAPVGTPLKLSGPAGKAPAAAPPAAPPAVVVAAAPPPAAAKSKDPDAGIVGDDAPVKAAAAPPAPVVKAAPAGGGGTLVQVSAFTRQEDADVVVSALKRKGYAVFIRREPQDSYLHVQLGPYATHKEAEAMKEKLSSDGFNAMVK